LRLPDDDEGVTERWAEVKVGVGGGSEVVVDERVVEKEMARPRVAVLSSGLAEGPSRVWFLMRREDLLGFFGTTGGSLSSDGNSM
jgi:hypothetical protein